MAESRKRGGSCAVLGCLVMLFSIGIMVVNGRQTYIALVNHQPTAMTYAEFAEKTPDSHWLHITDAKMSLLGVTCFKRFGTIQELYIPVQGPDKKKGEPIRLFLRTRDAALIKRIEGFMKMTEGAKNKFELALLVAKTDLKIEMEAKGLVEDGTSLDKKKREKIEAKEENLAEDYVVIEQGTEPHLGGALTFLLVGFVVFAVMLVFVWSRVRGDDGDKEKTAPGEAPPVARAIPAAQEAEPADAQEE